MNPIFNFFQVALNFVCFVDGQDFQIAREDEGVTESEYIGQIIYKPEIPENNLLHQYNLIFSSKSLCGSLSTAFENQHKRKLLPIWDLGRLRSTYCSYIVAYYP